MRIIYFIIPILLLSCDRNECKNTNPVFDKYAPESKEYKEELVRQIGKYEKGEIEYWIDRYFAKDNKEYMQVWVQHKTICAKAILDITGNASLENFRNVKGVSYSGAELKGLDYVITNDNNNYQFIFKSVEDITD